MTLFKSRTLANKLDQGLKINQEFNQYLTPGEMLVLGKNPPSHWSCQHHQQVTFSSKQAHLYLTHNQEEYNQQSHRQSEPQTGINKHHQQN